MLYVERGYAAVSRRLSVCPSVCDNLVCFSHRLEYFENNFMADKLKVSTRSDPNMGDLVQREHSQVSEGAVY